MYTNVLFSTSKYFYYFTSANDTYHRLYLLLFSPIICLQSCLSSLVFHIFLITPFLIYNVLSNHYFSFFNRLQLLYFVLYLLIEIVSISIPPNFFFISLIPVTCPLSYCQPIRVTIIVYKHCHLR